MQLKRTLTAFVATLALALPAAAQDCVGRNLFGDMAPERLAELRAAIQTVPYHQGLFWKAEKGTMQATLIGTYHFADRRHDLAMARFGPEIDSAGALLVEATPEDEARLAQELQDNPALIVNGSGPTLPERLTAKEWQTLSAALEQRGVPDIVAAKLQPWYVAVMLGISPCMMRMVEKRGDAGGLDQMLTDRAEAAHVPIRALESWDTVFTLFMDMTGAEEEDMIRTAMPAAEYADDYTVTLSDAYFAGDSWLMWEFGRFDAYDHSGLSRAEVDGQMQMAQDRLMDQRNENWIAPIENAAAEAAAQDKAIVVGFGALHLPGENGVLRLLERAGWTISPIKVEGIGNGG